MGNGSNLNAVTRFQDNVADINHSIKIFDFKQAEEDIGELEKMTKDEACLEPLREAKELLTRVKEIFDKGDKSYFEALKDSFKHNAGEERFSSIRASFNTKVGEYFRVADRIKANLSYACDLFISRSNYSTT